MSEPNRLDPVALDRWITGNYGEDQFQDDDEEEEEVDYEEDEAWWDANEDRIMEERGIALLTQRYGAETILRLSIPRDS